MGYKTVAGFQFNNTGIVKVEYALITRHKKITSIGLLEIWVATLKTA